MSIVDKRLNVCRLKVDISDLFNIFWFYSCHMY